MITQRELDKIANLYWRTKKIKYKELWYQGVKEFVNGRISVVADSLSAASGRNLFKRRLSTDKRANFDCMYGIWRST